MVRPWARAKEPNPRAADDVMASNASLEVHGSGPRAPSGRWLRRTTWTAGLVAALAACAWFLSAPQPAYPSRDAGALERGGDPERGRVVFAAGDCASCHASPGQPDRLRLGGGMALDTT